MEPALRYCWTVIALLAVLLQTGTALRCWTCQSDTNPDCGDPFESIGNMPTPCIPDLNNKGEDMSPVCTKAKIKVNDLESYVVRMCEWILPSHPSFCEYDQLPAHSKVEHCSHCRGDGCNGSSQVVPGVALIITITTLLRAYLL